MSEVGCTAVGVESVGAECVAGRVRILIALFRILCNSFVVSLTIECGMDPFSNKYRRNKKKHSALYLNAYYSVVLSLKDYNLMLNRLINLIHFICFVAVCAASILCHMTQQYLQERIC